MVINVNLLHLPSITAGGTIPETRPEVLALGESMNSYNEARKEVEKLIREYPESSQEAKEEAWEKHPKLTKEERAAFNSWEEVEKENSSRAKMRVEIIERVDENVQQAYVFAAEEFGKVMQETGSIRNIRDLPDGANFQNRLKVASDTIMEGGRSLTGEYRRRMAELGKGYERQLDGERFQESVPAAGSRSILAGIRDKVGQYKRRLGGPPAAASDNVPMEEFRQGGALVKYANARDALEKSRAADASTSQQQNTTSFDADLAASRRAVTDGKQQQPHHSLFRRPGDRSSTVGIIGGVVGGNQLDVPVDVGPQHVTFPQSRSTPKLGSIGDAVAPLEPPRLARRQPIPLPPESEPNRPTLQIRVERPRTTSTTGNPTDSSSRSNDRGDGSPRGGGRRGGRGGRSS